MDSRISCYLSHSIRGKKGKDATREDMDANNEKAIEFAKRLRIWFPKLDLYAPAEHDEFVIEAFMHGFITESNILVTDCNILLKRDFLLVYTPDGFISNGMGVEIGCAQRYNKPVHYIAGYASDQLCNLKHFIDQNFLRG